MTTLVAAPVGQTSLGQRALTLVRTDRALSLTALRIALGSVMFPHGAQKAFGWFGGFGFDATMNYMTQTAGLPRLIAFCVICTELIGPFALLLGLGTRVAAAAVGAVMVGAIAVVHWPYGFFMNWFGTQAGEGFEFHLLVLGMVAALVLGGGGRWSVDRRIAA